MTRTTAKPGMVEHKVGHGMKDFDFAYIEEIPYNDKISVRNVVKGLEAKDKALELENKSLRESISNLEKENVIIKEKVSQLEALILKVETAYYEALKGVISR